MLQRLANYLKSLFFSLFLGPVKTQKLKKPKDLVKNVRKYSSLSDLDDTAARYTALRDSILETYLLFSDEFKKASIPEMENVATLWTVTYSGITTSLSRAFSAQDETELRKGLQSLDEAVRAILKDLPSNSGGHNDGGNFFNYNGPKGEA